MNGVQGNQAAQVRMFAHDAIPVAIGAINPEFGITLDSGGYGYSVGNEITLNNSGAAAKIKVTSLQTQNIINVQANGGKFYLNGEEKPAISLNRGTTYVFYQKAISNGSSMGAGHPLKFSETSDGTHAPGGSEYTNGVTQNDLTAAYQRVVTFTVPSNAPNTLHYYCPNHSGMGAAITIQDSGNDFFDTFPNNNAINGFEVIRQNTAKPFGAGYSLGNNVQPGVETFSNSLPSAFIGKVANIDLPGTDQRGACLYIGSKMTSVTAKMESGESATFKSINAGAFMPVLVKEITAAVADSGSLQDNDIIALY